MPLLGTESVLPRRLVPAACPGVARRAKPEAHRAKTEVPTLSVGTKTGIRPLLLLLLPLLFHGILNPESGVRSSEHCSTKRRGCRPDAYTRNCHQNADCCCCFFCCCFTESGIRYPVSGILLLFPFTPSTHSQAGDSTVTLGPRPSQHTAPRTPGHTTMFRIVAHQCAVPLCSLCLLCRPASSCCCFFCFFSLPCPSVSFRGSQLLFLLLTFEFPAPSEVEGGVSSCDYHLPRVARSTSPARSNSSAVRSW